VGWVDLFPCLEYSKNQTSWQPVFMNLKIMIVEDLIPDQDISLSSKHAELIMKGGNPFT